MSISDFIKGVFIGIANILPGVSGGALAVSMGIYDQLIAAVTHFFQEPTKSIRTLFPYGLGAAAGIVGFSFSAEYLFEHYPVQTSMTFIGLILGGIPAILALIRTGHDKHQWSLMPVLLCLFTFLLVMNLSLAQTGSQTDMVLSPSVPTALWMILVGVIAAATIVIPGISGSMILMMLGVYQPLLHCINSFLKNVFTLQFASALSECLILVPLGLGLVAGIFFCAWVMEFFMKRFQSLTYSGILGLVLSSPAAILMEIPAQAFTISSMLSGIILLILALLFSRYIE